MSDNSNDKIPSGDLVFAAVFLLLSVFLLAQFPDQIRWIKRSTLVAQPGFWPAVSLIGMVFFGALHLLTRLRFADLRREWGEVAIWLRSLEFAIWFMVYVFVVPVIGYLGATLIFSVALTWRMGYRRGRMLLAALFTGFATVLLFKTFLSVKIPGGMVYEWLPDGLRSFMIIHF